MTKLYGKNIQYSTHDTEKHTNIAYDLSKLLCYNLPSFDLDSRDISYNFIDNILRRSTHNIPFMILKNKLLENRKTKTSQLTTTE